MDRAESAPAAEKEHEATSEETRGAYNCLKKVYGKPSEYKAQNIRERERLLDELSTLRATLSVSESDRAQLAQELRLQKCINEGLALEKEKLLREKKQLMADMEIQHLKTLKVMEELDATKDQLENTRLSPPRQVSLLKKLFKN